MGETPADLRDTQVLGDRTREHVVPATGCLPLALHHMVAAGVSEAGPGFQWVRRQPDISVLLACVAGHGQVRVGEQWVVCAPGSAYLAPRGALHAYHTSGDERWTLAWVIYQEGPQQAPLVDVPAPTLVPLAAEPLHASILGLYGEFIGSAEPAFLRHWADLVHLHVERAVRRRREGRLARVWEAVDGDLARAWTVRDLAELAHVSSEQLRLLCHRHLGRSPLRQVTQLRMQRATHLLRATGWSVEAVALAVGYDNAFAFSTAFRRWAGVPPSGFRAGSAGNRAEAGPP
ncbi:AraC family transcriptional regulator (plasmid) [Deinococcus aetherius]|uniref:AraC family transcriptional regulator n=1 Tax=Deinococcus aetherius TaxID=200252 RepID=A0ABN6RQJ2_9DEIO|nr:AraC family transcriptional regulator [Deinococcus aetherius]BDP43912.1 AraC family transcriptional regulator [Deinococcus aetherius]